MKNQHDPMYKQADETDEIVVHVTAIELKSENVKYPCSVLQLKGILDKRKRSVTLKMRSN